MNAIRNHPISINLLRTIVYLCFGSGITLVLLILILVALRTNESNNFAVPFLAMGVSAGVGGSLWARSILKNRITGSVWRAALRPGIAFGVSVFIAAYILELIERDLFYRNLLHASGSHLQFLGLFSIGIFLVAGITSAALTAQVLDRQQALRHGVMTGLVCSALFIAVDLLMYVLGWRVGAPDFPERATMLTVMGLGLSVSLVAGGTLLGVGIDKSNGEEDEK